MDLEKIKWEYMDNPHKFPGVCCIDVLGLIREIERYKLALEIGARHLVRVVEEGVWQDSDDLVIEWLEKAEERMK